MATGSWDKTVRVHDLFSKTTKGEVLEHNSEVMSLDFKPDGKEICVATMKGELHLWDVADAYV